MLNKFLQTSCLTVAVGLTSVIGSDVARAVFPEILFPSIDQVRAQIQPSIPLKDPRTDQWRWYQNLMRFTSIDVDGRTWDLRAFITSPYYPLNEMHPSPPAVSAQDITFRPLELDDLLRDVHHDDSLQVRWHGSTPKWPEGSSVLVIAEWTANADTIPNSTFHVHRGDNPPHFVID
jgi:hypothetical protein